MRPLPPTTRVEILRRLSEGQSTRQVAEAVRVGKSTVADLRKGLPADTPRPKSGPQPKLSPRERRQVASSLLKGEVCTAVEATRALNERRTNPVCAETVRRALKRANLVARKRLRKPAISRVGQRTCLRWARASPSRPSRSKAK